MSVKEEEDLDGNNNNNNRKAGIGTGISRIAERRGGFNASSINAGHFSIFTVPPGLSPSALLDSPVMLHNAQGQQLSPTTGTFQFSSSPNDEERSKLGDNAAPPSTTIVTADHQNKPFEEFDQYGREMQQVSRKQAAIGGNNKSITSIEDGYLWRKYGQKHVKGSEYPRSYYKCTNPNCTVTKKVERCHQGQVSEIVYKGSHNHPEPLPSFKKNISELGAAVPTSNIMDHHHHHHHMLDDSSFHLASLPTSTTQEWTPTTLDQDHSDQSVSNDGHDADENGDLISEPRKRKRETMSYSESGAPRCTREPKVVVQIESDIDILDDGYRWRKYGQKVVKGNPNPRSYYKCTTPGCGVRKHVERAANDIKSVITTYEGKHNHEVPSSKSQLQVIHSHSHPQNNNNNNNNNNYRHQMNVVDEEVSGVYLERKAAGAAFNLQYPLSFPPFHSLPAYPPSLLASTSKLYPLIPDYHVSSLPPSAPPPPNLIHYNNLIYPSISMQPRDDNNIVIPKEEQRDHDDADLYDTCLSIPNHPN